LLKTWEAFNSIVLDDVANRPFNPMVNAGAIAVAALMPGNTAAHRHHARPILQPRSSWTSSAYTLPIVRPAS